MIARGFWTACAFASMVASCYCAVTGCTQHLLLLMVAGAVLCVAAYGFAYLADKTG